MDEANNIRSNSWKIRYSKLYCKHGGLRPKEIPTDRISFITYEPTYISELAYQQKSYNKAKKLSLNVDTIYTIDELEVDEIKPDEIKPDEACKQDTSKYGTMLLEMVRAKRNNLEQEKNDEPNLSQEMSDSEAYECVHGLNIRNNTDGSICRSRISRLSTRRDMDLPSILAFNPNIKPPQLTNELPAFGKIVRPATEKPPRWSIRRAQCPVCSEKWRDKSSINIVKNSGLKRYSSDMRSVMAPARLRTTLTTNYNPRPAVAALDADAGMIHGGWRSSKTNWQLTRARKFRAPKPLQTAELIIPVANAPKTEADLDSRVIKFLSN